MATSTETAKPNPALSALFDERSTRDRLMLAMSESLIEKGYAATVVADVVSRARVSRRTFYEEFTDRGDCLLAICDRSTDKARGLIAAAADPSLPWEEQVEHAVGAYFLFHTTEPRLTHALLFEIYGLGERGLASHRATSHAFTEQMIALADRSRAAGAPIRAISYATAAAVVGAIYQLVQLMSDDPQRISVEEARRAAIDLVLDSARPHS